MAMSAEEFLMQDQATSTGRAEDFLMQGMSEPEQDKAGFLQTAQSQIKQGATFGFADEIQDVIGAGIASLVTDESFDELYKQAQQMSEEQLTKEIRDRPLTSFVSQMIGGIATGKAGANFLAKANPNMAKSALKFAKNNPIKTSILAGGASGAAYGAGTADTGNRTSEALTSSGMGALMGPLGYYTAKQGAKLLQKGKNLLPKHAQKDGRRIVKTTFDDLVDADEIIPKSRGEALQDVEQLAAEDFALRQGAETALKAQNIKQKAAIDYFNRSFGKNIFTPDDVVESEHIENVATLLRGKADAARLVRQEAYKEAAKTSMGIRAIDVKTGLADTLDGLVDEFNIEDLPKADRLYKRINRLVREGDNLERGVLLKELEKWNKSARALADETSKNFRGDTEESLLIETMRKTYNEFLDEVSEQALLNGDEIAIDNFKKARALAANEFKLYKADKTIKNIIQNRDLTNEQLVNTIIGSHKLDSSKTQNLARIYDTLIEGAGDDALVLKDNIRNGLLARVLKKSFSNTPNPMDPGSNLIDFAKMRNSLDDLVVGNKSLFEKAFSPEEQKIISTLRSDLRKIAADQTGAKNYSNSAVAAAQAIRRALPLRMFTSTLASGLQGMGESAIESKGVVGLENVLKETYDALDGAPAFYGGLMAGSAVNREEE